MTTKPTFGICSPSSYAREERFEPGLQKLRELGHELVIHPQAYGRLGETQLAGTVQEKITALYDLCANPAVDFILTACGGNGALHLLDHLDYTKITKPMIGFSDTTGLLHPLYARTGLVTYHGPGVTYFDPARFRQAAYDQLITLLTQGMMDLPLMGTTIQTPGSTTGKMIGGNLAVFRDLVGTPYLPDTNGAILFFEDVSAELNQIDRTLCSMKLAGMFDRAAGLIFGEFTDMRDTGRPFGFTLDQIIAEHTRHLNIPVITNAPFGHSGMLPTFPIGATVTLDARQGPPKLVLVK